MAEIPITTAGLGRIPWISMTEADGVTYTVPGTPSAGLIYPYPKSDHLFYTKDSTGTERAFVNVSSTQTLTNKTLTSPTISGGTIDNSVIGGGTPAAITGTIITANTKLVASLIEPPSDSTTAILIKNAAGSSTYLTIDTTNGRLGIGTTPAAFLHVLGTTEQLRLGYDGSNYASFTVNNTGNLTIAPTGSTTLSSALTINAASPLTLKNGSGVTIASVSTLGHSIWGSASAPSANIVIQSNKTFTDPANLTSGIEGDISSTYTGASGNGIVGINSVLTIDPTGGNVTATFGGRAFRAIAQTAGSTNTVTGLAGLYAAVTNGGTGTLSNAYGVYVDSAANSGTFSTNYGIYVNSQTVGATNYVFFANGAGRFSVVGSETIASGASATWKGIEFRSATATVTGSTNITAGAGFNYIEVAAPTISAASALTVTNAASLKVVGAPSGGGVGPATLSNAYAFWVANGGGGGVSRFDGDMKFSPADATNFIFGTSTGTKIGTATNQKLSFWNAATIVQPTTAIAAATFVANTSGIVNDTATFDGYTIGQLAKIIRNLGLAA